MCEPIEVCKDLGNTVVNSGSAVCLKTYFSSLMSLREYEGTKSSSLLSC